MCDGSDPEIVLNLHCTVLMSEFWHAPFSNTLGDIIRAKVVATNERGNSLESDSNLVGADLQTVPGQMLVVTRGADTSATQVQVDWQEPVELGNSPITAYELVMTQPVHKVLFSTEAYYTGFEYTVVDDVTPGVLYFFEIRAQNKWGFGVKSAVSDGILAATVPERVDVPSTEIDSVSGDLLISWTAPYYNGAAIEAY